MGSTLVDNGVGKMIYQDFLPVALAEGRYLADPPPYAVGAGLEKVQNGFEIQKGGDVGEEGCYLSLSGLDRPTGNDAMYGAKLRRARAASHMSVAAIAYGK